MSTQCFAKFYYKLTQKHVIPIFYNDSADTWFELIQAAVRIQLDMMKQKENQIFVQEQGLLRLYPERLENLTLE